jgi:hypothetical protein
MNLTFNILTTLSARIVTLGLSLISSIVLARWLGPEGRGVFALVLLLPGLAMSLGLLGFDQANAVFSGLAPARRRQLFWHSVAIALGVGCVITVGGIWFVTLGAPGFGGMVRAPFVLYVLALASVPARMASEYWSAILRGMNRIVLLNALEVGMKVIALSLLAVFVVWWGLGVTGAIWADFTLGVGTAVVMVVLLARVGVAGRPATDSALWKRTWAFAFPTYCAGVMTYLSYRIDQFIIAALLPAEALGFYVIAVDLAERLWILTGAVGTALLPHLTNSRDRDPALVAVVSRHCDVLDGRGVPSPVPPRRLRRDNSLFLGVCARGRSASVVAAGHSRVDREQSRGGRAGGSREDSIHRLAQRRLRRHQHHREFRPDSVHGDLGGGARVDHFLLGRVGGGASVLSARNTSSVERTRAALERSVRVCGSVP